MEKSEGTPIIIGTLFIYSELICSSIINVHTVKGFLYPLGDLLINHLLFRIIFRGI